MQTLSEKAPASIPISPEDYYELTDTVVTPKGVNYILAAAASGMRHRQIADELKITEEHVGRIIAGNHRAAERTRREVVSVPVALLTPTPENWTIYRRPDESDPTWRELCESIRTSGITTPLTVSADHYIISGHRRYLAAIKSELPAVPCTIDDTISMAELPPADRVVLLTERNRGIRIKSDGELYLEAAASVDPEQAVREARARKAQVFNKIKTCLQAVESEGGIRRTDPTGERAALLKAVQDILQEKRDNNFLPTSGRHIHYSLLARKVRTSTRKNGHIYGSGPNDAALLSKLLTDARSAGEIDADDIDDGTRQTSTFPTSGSMGRYVSRTLENLFRNFVSEIHADQPAHVELLVEKNTVFPLLRGHVAWKYRLPITSLRGYGSYPAARDVAERYKQSGKNRLVVIYVSDLDPEGVDMPSSWKKYLEHDFHVNADVYRAAVTPEQVQRFNLPPDADVKLTSTRAAGFIEAHGDQCWELDSMPEAVLIQEVSKAVQSVLDIPAFNRAMKREEAADVRLARMNAAVRRFMNDHFRKELSA